MMQLSRRLLTQIVLACGVAAPGMTQTIAPAPAAPPLGTPAPPTPAAPLTPAQIKPGVSPPAPVPMPAAPAVPQQPVAPPEPVPTPAPPPPAPSRLDRVSPLGTKPDWSKLQMFHQCLTRTEFETVLRDVYTDNSPLPPPWKVETDGVVIQTGDPTKPEVRVGFSSRAVPSQPNLRTWKRAAELAPLNGRPPLSDVHIAIDPGHIGGGYAAMEERYLSFAPNESIQEGQLTLITAQVLAERLKALGAYVSLVRDQLAPVTDRRPNDLVDAAKQLLAEAGFPQPAQNYNNLTGDAKILTVQWQSEKLFYRVSEIHARAKKVNETIKPDVVLCLHYNAEAWGDATKPQFSPMNHMHVLVNGCYSPVELEQQDVRFEMFQRLLSRMHEEELPLAESVANGMRAATGLPAYVYTTPNARRAGTNAYVYARNLLANRIYECPVVYLEPYVMNNEEIYRRLLNGHYVGRSLVAGKLQTSAIEDYVRGVVNGLLAYYQKNRPQ